MRIIYLLLILAGTALAQTPEDVAGDWRGAIEVPGSPLEIGVTFEVQPGGLAGTIDIPAQGAQDVPLEDVRLEGEQLTFAIQGIPGKPTFSGPVSGDTIEGEFRQSGQTFPFSLKRGTRELARPQEPKPPLSLPRGGGHVHERQRDPSWNVDLTERGGAVCSSAADYRQRCPGPG